MRVCACEGVFGWESYVRERLRWSVWLEQGVSWAGFGGKRHFKRDGREREIERSWSGW